MRWLWHGHGMVFSCPLAVHEMVLYLHKKLDYVTSNSAPQALEKKYAVVQVGAEAGRVVRVKGAFANVSLAGLL